MERKAFTPQAVKASAGSGGEGTVSFIVATLDTVDSDGDVTRSGFFGRQHVQMIPTHDWSHVPIGKGLLYEDGRHAKVDAQFNLAIPEARSWYEAIKFDSENPPALQQYSYGYTVKAGGSSYGDFQGRRVRFLQPLKDGSPGVDVHEVSPVLLGAGAGTRTLAVKAAGDHLDARARAELMAIQARNERGVLKGIQERFMTSLRAAEEATKARCWYSQVWPPAGFDHTAKAIMRICAAELGMPMDELPTLEWFADESPGELEHATKYGDRPWPHFWHDKPVAGLYDGGEKTIWIAADLSLPEALATVAHEVRHWAGGGEDQAQAYERAWAAKLPSLN